MPECVFCKIIAGEVKTRKIYEDDTAIAFLDINPAAVGHTLVIPKMHHENIFDIDEITLRRLMGAVQKVARLIKEKMECEINILQSNGRNAGQIIEHIHFHIIPRHEGDNIRFFFPRIELKDEELDDIQRRLTS